MTDNHASVLAKEYFISYLTLILKNWEFSIDQATSFASSFSLKVIPRSMVLQHGPNLKWPLKKSMKKTMGFMYSNYPKRMRDINSKSEGFTWKSLKCLDSSIFLLVLTRQKSLRRKKITVFIKKYLIWIDYR